MSEKMNRLFWLSGSYYMRQNIVKKIKESVSDYSLSIYDESDSAEYIYSQITEPSLFDDNKIVILKAIPDFGKSHATNKKRLLAMFNEIPENCFVIIDGVSTKKSPALCKAVKKIGKVKEFEQFLKPRDASNWVSNRFSEKEKEISSEDVVFIVDSIGQEDKGVDVDKMYVCVKKICDYLGRDKKVTKESVIKASDKYNRLFVQGIFNALDDKNFVDCATTLYAACCTDKIKNVAETIFALCSWRFRMLWFVKESIARKKTLNDITNEIQNELPKLTRKGKGAFMSFTTDLTADGKTKSPYSNYVLNTCINGFYGNTPSIRKYKREDIFRAIKTLEECMIKMRFSQDDAEILLLLDNFFMTLTKSPFSYNELALLRRVD